MKSPKGVRGKTGMWTITSRNQWLNTAVKGNFTKRSYGTKTTSISPGFYQRNVPMGQ
ncbi:hypothetical protein ACFP1I_23940 [Dyadobacter subterraneus]|uniref:Uncharacterized protein n=1 Tax=Dyadobacter subterraneus TaxID=2773304 RepID=A0ABR9WNS7_9BACT|nr:hypothetical protein [Dyadobacter subterraneus]MBE9466501.1 hypothetical protein [Dyadobacter subterraneus]